MQCHLKSVSLAAHECLLHWSENVQSHHLVETPTTAQQNEQTSSDALQRRLCPDKHKHTLQLRLLHVQRTVPTHIGSADTTNAAPNGHAARAAWHTHHAQHGSRITPLLAQPHSTYSHQALASLRVRHGAHSARAVPRTASQAATRSGGMLMATHGHPAGPSRDAGGTGHAEASSSQLLFGPLAASKLGRPQRHACSARRTAYAAHTSDPSCRWRPACWAGIAAHRLIAQRWQRCALPSAVCAIGGQHAGSVLTN